MTNLCVHVVTQKFVMKTFPSLLFGFLLLAFCQPDYVSSATISKLPAFLSKKWDPYSRGAGDIEIGPDPTFQCPPNTPIAPHPERCELYYTCYAGYPVTLWQCYSDYLFDLRYSGCNFPYDTDCGDRLRPGQTPQTTTSTTTTTKPTPEPNVPAFTCPSDGGFYPIDSDGCYRHYYACVQGVAYVMLCPLDDLFDPVTFTCEPPNDVSCQESAFTCEEDGFFPVEGQCTGVYFICASGVAYESLCPNNGIFDPDKLICSTADQVSCSQGRNYFKLTLQ
uniref:Uncharacterized protein n=1 Tax=Daphnia magna TaxID=35525 RepID=A0A0P6FQI5_9CRUS